LIAILSILVVCFLQIQGLIAIKPYDTHQDLLIGTVMHLLICVAQRILVESYDAANCTKAFEKMSTFTYNLVLIDLVMPDIDGAEVVRRIRSQSSELFCSVPVIALTANLAEEALNACEAAVIQEIIPKLFDRHILIRSVRYHNIHKEVEVL
jgi:CheY-like chemotaxis protein